MSSANQTAPVKHDWLPENCRGDWMLANPWLWILTGLALAAWSLGWTLMYRQEASDARVVVLSIGLLFGGVGVWLRWRDRQSVYLRGWQAPLSLLLGLFFALACLAVTAALILSFKASFGLYTAPLVLVWLSAAPPTFFAARRCLTRTSEGVPQGVAHAETNRAETIELEIALAFVAAAAVCVLGSYTLFADPADPTDWDTMRMFLRVVTAVSLVAGSLVLVTAQVRRLVLSFLFLLHFAGINTAALSAPPAPWIVAQIWMRLFRPYLEFAYLNNAYHFYAPEPGPASYVWFRIIYQDPERKADDEGTWFKIPKLDDDGNNLHPVALDYQRFLSLTENIAHPGALPPAEVWNPKTKRLEENPFWKVRIRLGDEASEPLPLIVGKKETVLQVPFHPIYRRNYNAQVRVPQDHCRQLLASYARYVARRFADHPEKPGWKFKSVKIYHVVHTIPPVKWFTTEIPPTDPELYYPFYVGNFEADGDPVRLRHPDGSLMRNEDGLLIYETDPYLYWLLPSIRDNPSDPDSQIRDWAREHAGDSKYMRRGTDRRWVTWNERDILPPQPRK